jgi:hypothetical protein
MLLGLVVTVRWIDLPERLPNGDLKTLEDWQVGRPKPNNFAESTVAQFVEGVWKWAVGVVQALDAWLSGEEGEAEGGEDAEPQPQVSSPQTQMVERGNGAVGGWRTLPAPPN